MGVPNGDFVETPDGEWYAVFLTGRPLSRRGRCTLGRESAIERIEWRDGWPWLAAGGRVPRREVEAPELPPHPFEPEPPRDDFDSAELNIHFQALLVPMTQDCRCFGNQLAIVHYTLLVVSTVVCH